MGRERVRNSSHTRGSRSCEDLPSHLNRPGRPTFHFFLLGNFPLTPFKDLFGWGFRHNDPLVSSSLSEREDRKIFLALLCTNTTLTQSRRGPVSYTCP